MNIPGINYNCFYLTSQLAMITDEFSIYKPDFGPINAPTAYKWPLSPRSITVCRPRRLNAAEKSGSLQSSPSPSPRRPIPAHQPSTNRRFCGTTWSVSLCCTLIPHTEFTCCLPDTCSSKRSCAVRLSCIVYIVIIYNYFLNHVLQYSVVLFDTDCFVFI